MTVIDEDFKSDRYLAGFIDLIVAQVFGMFLLMIYTQNYSEKAMLAIPAIMAGFSMLQGLGGHLIAFYGTGFNLESNEDYITLWLIVCYILYYFLSETIFGTTIGKRKQNLKISKLEVEQNPNIFQISLRSLFRMFPFDGLIFMLFGYCIHDSWSKTRIIRVKKSSEDNEKSSK